MKFFLRRFCFIFTNLPSYCAWITIIMTRLMPLITAWIWCIFVEVLLAVPMGCVIFLSLFLDVKRISIQLFLSSFPAEWFPMAYDINGFKFRINRYLSSVGCIWSALLYVFPWCLLHFIPWFVVAVQLFTEFIQSKRYCLLFVTVQFEIIISKVLKIF